jgi:hypothetical protein
LSISRRTEVGTTTEATEFTEWVKTGVPVRTLSELCAQWFNPETDMGPESDIEAHHRDTKK